jgi:hypothetical protein
MRLRARGHIIYRRNMAEGLSFEIAGLRRTEEEHDHIT